MHESPVSKPMEHVEAWCRRRVHTFRLDQWMTRFESPPSKLSEATVAGGYPQDG